ncbi:MAG: acetate--CoA ligase family protein, partial [Dehalococcoidales bacterium]
MTGQQLIDKAKAEGRNLLTEIEAKELLKQAGIPVIETKLATSKEQAISLSKEMGLPVALKITS